MVETPPRTCVGRTCLHRTPRSKTDLQTSSTVPNLLIEDAELSKETRVCVPAHGSTHLPSQGSEAATCKSREKRSRSCTDGEKMSLETAARIEVRLHRGR